MKSAVTDSRGTHTLLEGKLTCSILRAKCMQYVILQIIRVIPAYIESILKSELDAKAPTPPGDDNSRSTGQEMSSL